MFAVAFPLAPLMAYVNNYFEYTIDLQNLMRVSEVTHITHDYSKANFYQSILV
jgi:hypothetical protein